MNKFNEEKAEKRTGIAANIATVVAAIISIIALFISSVASYHVDKMEILISNSQSIIDSLSVQVSELELRIDNLTLNQQTNNSSPHSINGNNNTINNIISDMSSYGTDALLQMAYYSMENQQYEDASKIYLLEQLKEEPNALNSLGIIYAYDQGMFDLPKALQCFYSALMYNSNENDEQIIQNNILLALNKNPDYYEDTLKFARQFCEKGNSEACSLLESALRHETVNLSDSECFTIDIEKYANLLQEDLYSWNREVLVSDRQLSLDILVNDFHYPSNYMKLEYYGQKIYSQEDYVLSSYIYGVYKYTNPFFENKNFIYYTPN